MREILIIDDDSEIHDLIRDALDPERYRIRSAFDGVEGLAQLRSQRPDLVVLDIQMPRMTGWEVLQQMKKDSDLAIVPLVMFTTIADADARRLGFDLGADAYLEKPFEVFVLVRRIDYLLHLRMAALDGLSASAAKKPY